MRILFVGRNCQVGGGPTFRLRASLGLIERGHEISLAAQGGSLQPRFEQAGVKVHLLPPTPFNRFKLASLIKKGNYDVVHACNATAGDDLVSVMRKLGDKAPAWVMSIHGNMPAYAKGNECLRQAGEVMTFDQSALDRLNEIPWMRERHVHMMPRPVEKRDLKVGPLTPPHIVMVSRLSKTKGPAALAAIEAVQKLEPRYPRLSLTIFGDGSMHDAVVARGKKLNELLGREIVRAPGRVNDPFKAMAGAAVVIGTSYVAFEALFHGIPVVAAGYEGYGTITAANLDHAVACNFGDGYPGIQPVITPKWIEGELDCALIRFASDEGRVELANIRERLEARHALNSVAERLEGIYLAAIEAKNREAVVSR